MSKEFISLFFDIFPFIEKKDSLIDFIEQHNTFNDAKISYRPNKEIVQCDILNDVPRLNLAIDDDGNLYQERHIGKAMVLSTSCDVLRNKSVVFAPLIDIREVNNYNKLKSIKDNISYNYFYINEDKYKDYAIDFNLMFSLDLEIFYLLIEKGNITKESQLNDYGYYFFMTKISMYFLRPEKKEEIDRQEKHR